MYVCVYIYIYIYIYTYIHIYTYVHAYMHACVYMQRPQIRQGPQPTANLRAKMLDFEGFDSKHNLHLNGGNSHVHRGFPGKLGLAQRPQIRQGVQPRFIWVVTILLVLDFSKSLSLSRSFLVLSLKTTPPLHVRINVLVHNNIISYNLI